MISKNELESSWGGYNLSLGIPLLERENLEVANAPNNPCYHHIDAAYDCSMFMNCLTHFVSVQVINLQHAMPVQQGYVKLHPTTDNITHS